MTDERLQEIFDSTAADVPDVHLIFGRAVAQAATMKANQWRPIADAPRNRTPILLKFKDSFPSDTKWIRQWLGLTFVGQSLSKEDGWSFAAPVGQGGFPDFWLDGWLPLPPTGTGGNHGFA